jgi:nucleoid-associated protein Lsr2
MTTKHVILIQDDLDGSEASETVQFGLDGATWEIDLNAKNAKALRKAVSDWVSHARRTGGRAKRGTAAKAAFDGVDNRSVRAWAKSNGIKVNTRGRISAEIVEQYRAAGH